MKYEREREKEREREIVWVSVNEIERNPLKSQLKTLLKQKKSKRGLKGGCKDNSKF